jgi:hypothetical protein
MVRIGMARIEMISAEEHRAKMAEKDQVFQVILDLSCNELLSWEQACREIESRAAAALGVRRAQEEVRS